MHECQCTIEGDIFNGLMSWGEARPDFYYLVFPACWGSMHGNFYIIDKTEADRFKTKVKTQ